MTYALPIPGRTRIAALADTPAIEERLKAFFAESGRGGVVPGSVTWESFLAQFGDDVVSGSAVRGIILTVGKSFVTGDVGYPEIDFPGPPQSLLFVFSHYELARSSSSMAYRSLMPGYFRWRVHPSVYAPTEANLVSVYAEIELLKKKMAEKEEVGTLADSVNLLQSNVNALTGREDPLSAVLPAIAAEAEIRAAKDRDFQTQINTLQAPVAGSIDLTSVYKKTEVDDLLGLKANVGDLDAAVADRVKKVDFDNHSMDRTAHPMNYRDVGAPSRREYEYLLELITDLRTRLAAQEALNPVTDINTAGGLLSSETAPGVWVVDGSYLNLGDINRPEEVEFFRGGVLQIEDGEGKWYAWEQMQIIGVRASVSDSPEGLPIVVDLKKNGVSIYTTVQRPTIADGETTVLAELPDQFLIEKDDFLQVDIVQVGTVFQGSNLSVQVTMFYVQ